MGHATAVAQEPSKPVDLPVIERCPDRAYTTPFIDERSGLLYAVYRSFTIYPYDVTLSPLDNMDSAFYAAGLNDLQDDDPDSYSRRLRGHIGTPEEWARSKTEKRLLTLMKGEGVAGIIPIWNTLFWENLVAEGLEDKPKRYFYFSTGGAYPVAIFESGRMKFGESMDYNDKLILGKAALKRLRALAPEKRTEDIRNPGMKGKYAVTPLLDAKRGTLILVIRSLSDKTVRIHMKSIEGIREAWNLSDRQDPAQPPPPAPESPLTPQPKEPLKRVVDLHTGEGIVGSVFIWETPLWSELIHEGKPRHEKVSIAAHPAIYTSNDEGHPVPDRDGPLPILESLTLDAATLTRIERFRIEKGGLLGSPIRDNPSLPAE